MPTELCQTTQALYAMETMAFASHTKRGCDCGAYIRVVDSLARNCGLKKNKLLNMLTVMFRLKRVSFWHLYLLTFFFVEPRAPTGARLMFGRSNRTWIDGTAKRGDVVLTFDS